MRSLAPALVWAHGPALAFLLVVLVFGRVKDVPLCDLTRDPTAVMNAPVYIGVLSNAGILIWCSAAAVCFFAFALQTPAARWSGRGAFLLCSGVLTTVLLLDDFFLLHEKVFPRLGAPEQVVYALYCLGGLAWLGRFAGLLEPAERALVFLAAGWFGASVVMDLVPVHSPGLFFVEDGLKFLGIAAWSAGLASASFRECSDYGRVRMAERFQPP